MKKVFMPVMAAVLITGTMMFTSCKKDKVITPPLTTETSLVQVNFTSSSPFVFFSFKNKAVVANTDSATSKWDFGLRLTTFLVNSNASGPGNAGVIMQDGIFDDILAIPSSGYAYDTAANKLAIKDGSWYNYNPVTHAFTPRPGKVFLFRTAEGKYAKMEILEVSYEPFSGPMPQKINYRIRFVYQGNGSMNF